MSRTIETQQTTQHALFALRVTLGGLIMFWGMAGLQGVTRGKVLFASLPHTVLGPEAAALLAIGEITLGAFVVIGLARGLSYGAAFFLQALATFASHAALTHVFDDANVITVLAIPVLVAHGVLFTLRREDRFLSADRLLMRPQKRPRVSHAAPVSAPSEIEPVG